MAVRTFETGATRSPIEGKLRYEGFFNPRVLQIYADYMHRHRKQSDGSLREPDNWQKGMPKESYADSGIRHAMDWWLHHRGYTEHTAEPLQDTLCAIMFNCMGYLLALEKEKPVVQSHLSNRIAAQPSYPNDCCPHTEDRIGF